MVTVGLPGILLALLMFTIAEPRRIGVRTDTPQGFAWGEVWEFVRGRARYLTFHFIAYLCLSIQGFAFLTWVVEFFVRKHGWTRTEIGWGSVTVTSGRVDTGAPGIA